MIAEREVEAVPIKKPTLPESSGDTASSTPNGSLKKADESASGSAASSSGPAAGEGTAEGSTTPAASGGDVAGSESKAEDVSSGSPTVGKEGVAAADGMKAESTTDNPSSDATGTVKITGAVEMKGIVGSDNRSYLLDVSRLTPRDANWVRGDKGTGVYGDWTKVCVIGD